MLVEAVRRSTPNPFFITSQYIRLMIDEGDLPTEQPARETSGFSRQHARSVFLTVQPGETSPSGGIVE